MMPLWRCYYAAMPMLCRRYARFYDAVMALLWRSYAAVMYAAVMPQL